MSGGDVEILRRAHALFDLATTHPLLEDPGAGRLPSAAAAGAMAAATGAPLRPGSTTCVAPVMSTPG